MKRILALALCAALILSLCGCSAKYMEALDGTWIQYDPYESDDMLDNLSTLAFYDDELEYADLEGCSSVYCVTFDAENKTYTLGYDEDMTRECLRTYLDSFFSTLYEHRADIGSYAGQADDCASADEFKEWYASAFFTDAYTDYADMLDDMTDTVMSWYELPYETGTYTASSTRIVFTVTETADRAQANYTLDGDELSIAFANSTETFAKY